MSKLQWLAMGKKEYQEELEEADHLELLEIVAEKYKLIGDINDCECEEKTKTANGQCPYSNFHKEMALKLQALIEECHKFHGI